MQSPFSESIEPDNLRERMEGFEKKLARLVREHKRLNEENRQFSEERRQLRATIEKQREEIRNFQNQVKSSKIVSSIASGPSEAGALRSQIDEYIKEIERCIAHLSE